MTGSSTRSNSAERAVIDIGSNTVRMVIYGGSPRVPEMLFNEKVVARLGRGVGETGMLSKDASKLALAALRRFALLLDMRGVGSVTAVATAAVRDANNGAAFLDKVAETGLVPRLLSGAEEARTSALGVACAFPGARGVVADLGGGSLELVPVRNLDCATGVTLPLGALQLGALRQAGTAKFARRVRKLARAGVPACKDGEALYLVGGSFRAFARYAMHQLKWPLDDPHGFELPPESAIRLCGKLTRAKLPPVVPGLSAQRQAGLADAAALLAALVHELAPARLVFSSWGLREGLLMAAQPPEVHAQDPLVTGVAAFAGRAGVDAANATMIAGWTASAVPVISPRHERLRLAATMLAMVSQHIEPNLRGETAMGWALRKRWIGISAEERAILASALIANVGGMASPAYLTRLASAERLAEGRAWGLAVRLARRFSGLLPQALAGSTLTSDETKLTLSVDPECRALVSGGVERDLKNLAAHLGLAPEVTKAMAAVL